LKKIIIKKKCGNTVTIHSVLKKKITKLNSQPTQYEKNKIKKDNSKKKTKKEKKNHLEKHRSNPQCFKEKNYKAKFSISSILKKIKSTKTILKKKHTKIKTILKKKQKNRKK
jgi:hypothetical protein